MLERMIELTSPYAAPLPFQPDEAMQCSRVGGTEDFFFFFFSFTAARKNEEAEITQKESGA